MLLYVYPISAQLNEIKQIQTQGELDMGPTGECKVSTCTLLVQHNFVNWLASSASQS